MKRTFAMAVAVAASALTAGAGSQPAVAPCVTVSAQKAPSAPNPAGAGAQNVLESIPKTSLWLGLRMQNGKMYAINGSGGADADITPHIVIGPYSSTPTFIPVKPPVAPPLIPPKPAPHR